MLTCVFFRRHKLNRYRRPAKNYLENKEKAREHILARLEYYNRFYCLNWNRVAIKNTLHRWGSCSRKGNLNFCYKILFLPQDLVDYVVVHELCHLNHFNHSREFWEAIGTTLPAYRQLRKKLLNHTL